MYYYLQVGDFVLVEDETETKNDFKMVGLETSVCMWFGSHILL